MSPTRPEYRALYPKNWKRISAAIRARPGGRCECVGECGLHQPKEVHSTYYLPTGHALGFGEIVHRRCVEVHGEQATYARGKVILTVAHLNHDPADCRPDNLRAMCQRCHLRYDSKLHQRHAAETRRAKKNIVEMPL